MMREIWENKHEYVNILCLYVLEKKKMWWWLDLFPSSVAYDVEYSRKEEYTLDGDNIWLYIIPSSYFAYKMFL